MILYETRADDKVQSVRDLLVLKSMVQKIRLVLDTVYTDTLRTESADTHAGERLGTARSPRSFKLTLGKRRMQRITVLDSGPEWLHRPLSFVGFVGERQQDVAPAIRDELFKADEEVTRGLVNIPDFVYYSSLELRPELWYNLVIMKHSDARMHLRQSPAHRHAAYQLAPDYYQWIRLHSGTMPAGLNGGLLLQKTKVFTHQAMERRFVVQELQY